MKLSNLATMIAISAIMGLTLSSCGGGGSSSSKVIEPLYKLSENGDYIYEDGEDNTTKGWVLYINDGNDTSSITSEFDEKKKSSVIKTMMTNREAGYILGAPSGEQGAWDNTTSKTIKWDMQADSPYTAYIRINTEKGKRLLYYTAGENNVSINSYATKFFHSLEAESLNGNWQTYTRNLEQDLKHYEPNNNILSINAFTIRGSVSLDNIILLKKD